MMVFLKAGLLAIYAMALAGLAGFLPSGLAGVMLNITLVTLFIHVIEVVVMFKQVRLYQGPLAISIVLTLLYGLLHWKPLENAAKAAKAGSP